MGVDQILLNGASENSAVGNRLAKHAVVGVGVGIHMDHSDWAVFCGNGTQNGQGDGVVASQSDGLDVVL